MAVEQASDTPGTFGELGFDAFYDRNLPIVYGYLLRLCGGCVEEAKDLTQDTWVCFVDEVRSNRAAMLDVRWLVAVARTRYIDIWRRSQRLNRKLGLVWSQERARRSDDETVNGDAVITNLAELRGEHRVVLMLRYIDGLAVSEIARTIGRTTQATYSLLARARDELRVKTPGEDS